MKRMLQSAAWLLLLAGAPVVSAQVRIGDDLRMRMSGSLSGGYAATYGDQTPSSHSINLGPMRKSAATTTIQIS